MYRADRGSSRALENVSDFADQQFEDVFEEEDADDCSRITHEGAVRAGALHVAQRVFDRSSADTASRRRIRHGVIGCPRSSPVAYRTSLRCT